MNRGGGAFADHAFGSLMAQGPVIMGIVNVTPDSFSDGGRYFNPDKAIEHGLQLAREGAAILDIGGESSRPGANPVDPKEEIARVVPVIEGLAGCAPWISIDTRHAETMRAALDAGANAINDISALRYDSESLSVAVAAKVPVFLMHMQGMPQSMQKNPIYTNVVKDVFDFLKERVSVCETAGIERKNLVIDVGIGFGKTLEHNLLLLGNLKQFHGIGVPQLLGVSRKRFIGMLSRDEPPERRMPGSLAAALWGFSQGVQIFRVHDPAATFQALSIYGEIEKRNFGENEALRLSGYCHPDNS